MASRRSFPGSGSLLDVQLGDHWCLPVDGDIGRLDGMAGVADVGLSCGGKAEVFTATETPEQVAAYLAARVPGAAAALADGQLSVLAGDDFYLTGGMFDPDITVTRYTAEVELALKEGYRGLWVAVDMAWILSDPRGMDLLLDYEAGTNPGFASRRVTAACIYDRRRFCPALLEGVCSAHPLTPGQAPLRFAWTVDPPGLALDGEADLTNHRALAPLLRTLHEMPGHVTIDATGLRFADLRAADLVSEVSWARAPGSTTITGSATLNRLLALAQSCRSTTGGQPDV